MWCIAQMGNMGILLIVLEKFKTKFMRTKGSIALCCLNCQNILAKSFKRTGLITESSTAMFTNFSDYFIDLTGH